MKRLNFAYFLVLALAVTGATISIFPTYSHAYTVQNLTVDAKNDFVLEPGKAQLFLNPGETSTQSVSITDRIVGTTTFNVEVDDITGSQNPNQTVVILPAGEKGPYSGKDFIVPTTKQFTLSFGQEITIPVTITIPKDAPPGGYYSTVLISNAPSVLNASSTTEAQGSTQVISRIGTLYFIRVNGQANESGNLQSFDLKGSQKTYSSGPFTFDILFNNNGNVHLVPYGTITIKNLLGKEIATVPVDAYFSLPNSLRDRQVVWDQGSLFGRYTATLVLNRGYNNLSDTKTISFWVLPWKIIVVAFVIIFIIIALIFLIGRSFEIKRK